MAALIAPLSPSPKKAQPPAQHLSTLTSLVPKPTLVPSTLVCGHSTGLESHVVNGSARAFHSRALLALVGQSDLGQLHRGMARPLAAMSRVTARPRATSKATSRAVQFLAIEAIAESLPLSRAMAYQAHLRQKLRPYPEESCHVRIALYMRTIMTSISGRSMTIHETSARSHVV